MNKETKKQTILGYLFLIPSLAVFAVFMFYPLLYTFYLSFFEWNMVKPVKKFVGLGNYISVLKDPNTWKIFGNTFWYIVILLVFNFVMPYILSFILSCVIKKGQSFYKAVFFLPSVISLVVGSILYTWILNPISGPVAIVAGWFGLKLPFWSKTEGWVIAVLCIITTWKTFGYNFINILAGVSEWKFENGVAGFGFLALAVMIFGQWKPTRIALAALLFGLFRALSNVYAGFPFLAQMNIPGSVYNMMPYIISLVVLAFTSKNSRAPKAEGIPYDKGQR